MGAVHIKNEELVGSEATIRLEPSVYLQKLYKSGTPDLGWMDQMGEWGVRAKPGNLGLRLKDIEIGIPELPVQFDGYTILQLTDLHISRLFPASWARAVVD